MTAVPRCTRVKSAAPLTDGSSLNGWVGREAFHASAANSVAKTPVTAATHTTTVSISRSVSVDERQPVEALLSPQTAKYNSRNWLSPLARGARQSSGPTGDNSRCCKFWSVRAETFRRAWQLPRGVRTSTG